MKAEARLWVGLGCALVLALVAYGLVLSPDRRSAPGEATRELEEGRGRLAKPDLRSPEKEPGDPPSGVRPGTPAPEVSIAELEWDDSVWPGSYRPAAQQLLDGTRSAPSWQHITGSHRASRGSPEQSPNRDVRHARWPPGPPGTGATT